MFKRILLPTDGSELSRMAIEKGIQFARSIDAAVVGFFSPPDYSAMLYSEYIPARLMSQGDFEANARSVADEQLAFIEQAANAAGVRYEGYYRAHNAPWQAIIEAAQTKQCDLIFMASHGRSGLGALLLGSQTMKVLSHSKIPVLVYR